MKKKAVSGTADFKTSLQDADSVVVYLGHSVLNFKNQRSLGLSPMGHDSAEINPDALMDLLKASKAKLVTLSQGSLEPVSALCFVEIAR